MGDHRLSTGVPCGVCGERITGWTECFDGSDWHAQPCQHTTAQIAAVGERMNSQRVHFGQHAPDQPTPSKRPVPRIVAAAGCLFVAVYAATHLRTDPRLVAKAMDLVCVIVWWLIAFAVFKRGTR